MVKNKALQEERVKGYFIQAANELIKCEGLRAINVRGVSERAGYSYGTLYNYFKDINDLIFCCVQEYQQECAQRINGGLNEVVHGKERIKLIVLGYIDYFCEYPGIFDVFYLAKVGDFGNKVSTIELIAGSLDALCQEEWAYCIEHDHVDLATTERMKAQLRYTVIGMLVLYLNRRSPADYNAFLQEAGRCVNEILFAQSA